MADMLNLRHYQRLKDMNDNITTSTYEYTIQQYLKAARALKVFVKPLIKDTIINHVGYLAFYKNRTIIPISTHIEFFTLYLERRYYLIHCASTDYDSIKPGYYDPIYLYQDVEGAQEMINLRRQYGLANSFMLVKRNSGWFDTFAFHFKDDDPKHINFCMNNMDFFNKISNEILIEVNRLKKSLLPLTLDWSEIKDEDISDTFAHAHLQGFQGQPMSDDLIKKHVHLSVKEQAILYRLIQGMLPKEIAKDLNLSYRTIQNYLENIKLKYNCKSVVKLLSIFIDHNKVNL